MILLFAFTTGTAGAADDRPTETDAQGREIRYRERQELDFAEVEVLANAVKPSGVLLTESGRPRFNPMVRLRYDWDEEMVASTDEIK